jgi:peptidoglycan hydrolase-like protein with peptidoglycan-binding domain
MERDRHRALERKAVANSPQGKLVRQTQSALTLMGFDIGLADGQLNKETVDAIRAYQNSYKLLATGQPSDELLTHMKKNL